jgi:hypothetical protein
MSRLGVLAVAAETEGCCQVPRRPLATDHPLRAAAGARYRPPLLWRPPLRAASWSAGSWRGRPSTGGQGASPPCPGDLLLALMIDYRNWLKSASGVVGASYSGSTALPRGRLWSLAQLLRWPITDACTTCVGRLLSSQSALRAMAEKMPACCAASCRARCAVEYHLFKLTLAERPEFRRRAPVRAAQTGSPHAQFRAAAAPSPARQKRAGCPGSDVACALGLLMPSIACASIT